MLPTKEDYRKIIREALESKGYISQENEKSYSHKPHLASLPYDHTTNDVDKLKERKEEIENRIRLDSQRLDELKETQKYENILKKEVKQQQEKTDEYLKKAKEQYTNIQDLWKEANKIKTLIQQRKENHLDIRPPYHDSSYYDDFIENFEIAERNFQQIQETSWDNSHEYYQIITRFHNNLRICNETLEQSSIVLNNTPSEIMKELQDYSEKLKELSIIASPLEKHWRTVINYDKSNQELTDKKTTLNNLQKDNPNLKQNIRKTETRINDYKKEHKKTVDHIKREEK